MDSISIDSYIDDIKQDKKTNNNKLSDIIRNLDYDICSKNDDNIYDHVKKCNNCKNKLLHFLNDKSEIIEEKKHKKYKKYIDKYVKNLNIKEIIIIILLGVFIIIIMDLFISSKY